MVRLLIVIGLVISFTGCAGTKFIEEVVYAQHKMSTGDVQETLLSIEYTDVEQAIITRALNYTNSFRLKYGIELKNPDVIFDLDEELLVYDYATLKTLYLSVETIVEKHLEEYPLEIQNRLRAYQEHAIELNDSIESMKSEYNYVNAAKGALSYSLTLMKVIWSLK